MAASICQNSQGPFWPLGALTVATPGTKVNFMALVDPNNYNNPNTQVTPSSRANPGLTYKEYTARAQQILIQGIKPGASHGWQINTGNVYVLCAPQGTGAGNRDDTGCLVKIIYPGQDVYLASSAMDRNVFSPYFLWIDADNAGDGASVTLIIQ